MVFRLTIALPSTIIAGLAVCTFIVSCFSCLAHFSYWSTSWSSPCYDVFFERSPAAAGWMAFEMVKGYWDPRDVWEHSDGVLPMKARLNANFLKGT